jgi:5-formyltetrahydrofolate cyclo-ligase
MKEAAGAIRRRMRDARRNLPPDERRAAEQAIRKHLRRLGIWKPGRRVAAYLAFGGEVDLRECFDDAWQRGADLFVPRITHRRRGKMIFVPFTPATAFARNWYGIDEPESALGSQKFLRELDVVLVPMVAFDRYGHRLGNGAGYYDRMLRRRLDRSRAWRRPLLIGIAYSAQEAPCIERAPWDVAVDCVVTERGVIRPDPLTRQEAKS